MDDEVKKVRPSPQDRYAMISEKAYFFGEERRRRAQPDDPAEDWLMAEAEVDLLISAA